jgi:pyrroline-5-carboxylate reductase
MDQKSIGFIGGGRITKIFLKGFKNAGVEFSNIKVFDPNEESLHKLKGAMPEIEITTNNLEQLAMSEVIIVALHPPMLMEMLEKIKPFVQASTMIISLAPKITIEQIQGVLPEVSSIIRMNPNASNIINQGVNQVAFSNSMTDFNRTYVMELFGKLGKTFVVEESKIEAYAVICAMGSTYFCFQLQHLRDLGVQFGLDQEEAKYLIKDMMSGTINTLFFSDIPEEEVADLVPVKPIGEYEDTIKTFYSEKLTGIFNKIKPL